MLGSYGAASCAGACFARCAKGTERCEIRYKKIFANSKYFLISYYMKYLKQFVIGSSIIPTILYLISVQNIENKNYDYYRYSLAAPIWFGLWNMLSLYIAEKHGLNMTTRFLVISILSAFAIMIIARAMNSYNYSDDEWMKYNFYIFIKYMIVWNLIIYNVERLVE